MKITYTALIFCFSLYSVFTFAAKPDGSVYLDAGTSKNGLILAHGKGQDPTWLVVDPVRKAINKQLNFHTLSLQMPKGYDHWKDYADSFPMAYNTIEQAVNFLKNDKGVTNVYLFGHSMGSRMSGAYVSLNAGHGLSGLIIAGCRNNGGKPLACDKNVGALTLPILDVWGDKNRKDSTAASKRAHLISNTYSQVKISGANHKFEGKEDELVQAIVTWLQQEK